MRLMRATSSARSGVFRSSVIIETGNRGTTFFQRSSICRLGARGAAVGSRSLSSSHEIDRRAQQSRGRAARMRTMRDGETTLTAATMDEAVDYRCRNVRRGTSPSISSLWGDDAKKIETERQRQNRQLESSRTNYRREELTAGRKDRRKFVSFFDEIDSIMEKERSLHKTGRDVFKVSRSDSEVSYHATADHAVFSGSALHSEDLPPSTTALTGNKSIFDLFPAEPAKTPSPNAFERKLYEQYRDAMQETLSGRFFLKRNRKRQYYSEEFLAPVVDWLLKDEPVLPYAFPELRNDMSYSSAEKDVGRSIPFRKQVQDQRQAFLEKTGLTHDHYEAAKRGICCLVNFCARRCRAAPVEVAWEKMKEAGMIPDEETMSAIIYVVSTGGLGLSSSILTPLSGGSLSFGNSLFFESTGSILDTLDGNEVEASIDDKIQESEDKEDNDIMEEVSVFHDILFDPTEKSVSLRIKALISRGDGKGAEALLESFKVRRYLNKNDTKHSARCGQLSVHVLSAALHSQQEVLFCLPLLKKEFYKDSGKEVLRLRTYLPILKLYCEKGDVSSALSLFKIMRNTPTVLLEPENYVLLIATLAENGIFRCVFSMLFSSRQNIFCPVLRYQSATHSLISFFRLDSEPIEETKALGYSAASGPGLFDELVGEMAEDVLEITSG